MQYSLSIKIKHFLLVPQLTVMLSKQGYNYCGFMGERITFYKWLLFKNTNIFNFFQVMGWPLGEKIKLTGVKKKKKQIKVKKSSIAMK
jgi:hypothetical protein